MFTRPLVAIDIGSSAIKVVILGGRKEKKLLAAALEVLPAGLVVDGALRDVVQVEEKLRGLIKKLKIIPFARRVAVSLSGSTVLVKNIEVVAKGSELAQQVYYEAEQQFQADMSEVFFDFSAQGKPAKKGEVQKVLLVGAKRDMVEQYVGMMRRLGMRTGIVECSLFSVANMFEYNYGRINALIALVTIGSSLTQLSLIHSGDYLYTREIPIGGEEYTKRIMEVLSVDHENAESFKIAASQGDGNVPPEVQTVISEINDQLVGELQSSIDYFIQGSPESGSLTGLYMTGGGSRISGLDAAVAAALSVPVQVINPFQKVDVNSKKFDMDYISMQSHLYGVAVGLGLRSLGDHE